MGSTALIGVASANYAPPPDSNEWMPSSELVSRIDAKAIEAKLPAEFGNLSNYARYYFGTLKDGRKVVLGIFISPGIAHIVNGSPGIHIGAENQAPTIADGGCARELSFALAGDDSPHS